jgi:hypothetical protein
MNKSWNKGSSSVLVVFVILLLSLFGTLALMSSNAGLRLARKNAAWVKNIYILDGKGSKILSKISACLDRAEDLSFDSSSNSLNPVLFYNNAEKALKEIELTSSVKIIAGAPGEGLRLEAIVKNETTTDPVWLNICISVVVPDEIKKSKYIITSWKYENTVFTYDEFPDLWQGNEK